MLNEILRFKREEIRARKSGRRLEEFKTRIKDLDAPRGFQRVLLKPSTIHLIAEIKKASPSKGVLRPDLDPLDVAKMYEDHRASAISVLTDEHFFQGHLGLLEKVRNRVKIPVLQKDFLLDSFQIYEARVAHADAVLLISSLLERGQFSDYYALAKDLGLDVLCEVHDEKDLERVVETAEVIGINNRDLESFETDLETTFRVIKEIPDDKVVVSESGIASRGDVIRLSEVGVDAILVGESLMRAQDIETKIDELLGKVER
jgi:indole-3-glycerol phosphate synthase